MKTIVNISNKQPTEISKEWAKKYDVAIIEGTHAPQTINELATVLKSVDGAIVDPNAPFFPELMEHFFVTQNGEKAICLFGKDGYVHLVAFI